jgi:hypothetical protein
MLMPHRWSRNISVALMLLAMLVSVVARAQDSATSQAPKPLTPESSLNLRAIADLQFSPDGARLAFVVTEPPKGTDRARHIWLYD